MLSRDERPNKTSRRQNRGPTRKNLGQKMVPCRMTAWLSSAGIPTTSLATRRPHRCCRTFATGAFGYHARILVGLLKSTLVFSKTPTRSHTKYENTYISFSRFAAQTASTVIGKDCQSLHLLCNSTDFRGTIERNQSFDGRIHEGRGRKTSQVHS